ncbi:MAG: MoaD/ThiS family protein [Thermodesulfobacteriota bacterium]
MRVTVKLYNEMKRFAPADQTEFSVELKPGSMAVSILEILKIPEGEKFTLLVDGRRADAGTPLFDGSTLVLFPPISGG